MKNYLIWVLLFVHACLFSQQVDEYVYGKKGWYCPSADTSAMRTFNTGHKLLIFNRELNRQDLMLAGVFFYDAFKQDSTFCDAKYFMGYIQELIGVNKIKTMNSYYIADSLAQHRSCEFLSSLAQIGFELGTEKSLSYTRKAYINMINHFPEKSEGYFGYAMVAPFFLEDNRALTNIDIAIKKQIAATGRVNADVLLLKGVLLILTGKYEESIPYFKKSEPTFGKTDLYQIHYSLALLKSAGDDEKLKKKAKKEYDRIRNKNNIPIFLQRFFRF